MRKRFYSISISILCVLLALTACGKSPAPTNKVTITVWDYYGDPNATPIKPLIANFEAENPDISVDYQIMDWQTTLDKLNIALSGGTPPDVATIDMTWMPHFAALGALADLKTYMPDGQLNGLPLDQNYTAGSLEAMKYSGQILTMMYDFDAYALYYRVDLLEAKGIPVPVTWEDMVAALHTIGEDNLYKYELYPDSFHIAQFIYQNGGSILNEEATSATFNSPEAIQAFQFYTDLYLKEQVGIVWTADQGEDIQGIKDGRIAMFANGPYYMGLLKSGAPEMAGKWRVAIHPYSNSASSYLGGTGLVIPASSKKQEAAWKFIQYLLKPENAIAVYKYAGAAPALLQALNSPEVDQPDEYFGGQKTLEIFEQAMATAHPFPYVKQWTDIDGFISTSLQDILLNHAQVQTAVDSAAEQTNNILRK